MESRDEDVPPPRYGFGTYLGATWSSFRTSAGPAVGISLVLHLLAAFLPFLISFEVPEIAALPTVFLIRVVVPVSLGSIAIAVISVLMLRRRTEPAARIGDAVGLVRSSGMDLIAMSLVAALLAIVAVLFLGAYGFLLLHFFYGPPIAMQVLVSERLGLRQSLTTARAYLRGNWRLILYLFSVALGLGLVTFLVLGGVFTSVRSAPEPWGSLVLATSQGIVVGAVTAVVAAAQVALYLQLRALWPGPTEPEPEEPGSQQAED